MVHQYWIFGPKIESLVQCARYQDSTNRKIHFDEKRITVKCNDFINIIFRCRRENCYIFKEVVISSFYNYSNLNFWRENSHWKSCDFALKLNFPYKNIIYFKKINLKIRNHLFHFCQLTYYLSI